MADRVRQRPLLTREDVRTEAGRILGVIGASPRHEQRPAFERGWLLLWQLLREVKAAQLPSSDRVPGPWMWLNDGDGSADSTATLVAGDFLVESFPPGIARLALDLPIILNWAEVPIPWVQRG